MLAPKEKQSKLDGEVSTIFHKLSVAAYDDRGEKQYPFPKYHIFSEVLNHLEGKYLPTYSICWLQFFLLFLFKSCSLKFAERPEHRKELEIEMMQNEGRIFR